MMRNRRLIMVDHGKDLDWLALMENVSGLYHIRRIDSDKLFQIWFESPRDMDQFEKNLYLAKLGDVNNILIK
mgnify:FL=1